MVYWSLVLYLRMSTANPRVKKLENEGANAFHGVFCSPHLTCEENSS